MFSRSNLTSFLRELSNAKGVILVEGKNDLRALARFGIFNVKTLEAKRLRELPDFLESASQVILLLDNDKEGDKLTQKIKTFLTREGYIVNESFRERLKELGVICVEELNGKCDL
ncbi:MAG: toprim domain-containing protein [Aquificaceae bacterium]|nr:toprim domain-containing protein [Aquificaceae bacterium]MDW8237253.1 toprim domain-containing protein [Aquificaceae bacterium]